MTFDVLLFCSFFFITIRQCLISYIYIYTHPHTQPTHPPTTKTTNHNNNNQPYNTNNNKTTRVQTATPCKCLPPSLFALLSGIQTNVRRHIDTPNKWMTIME